MLPLTGLAAIVFTAWFLDSEGVKQELGLGPKGRVLWHYVSRYVAPIGVIVVFLNSL